MQTRNTAGIKKLQVIADRGYFKMEEIKATVDGGITPYVLKSPPEPVYCSSLNWRKGSDILETVVHPSHKWQ